MTILNNSNANQFLTTSDLTDDLSAELFPTVDDSIKIYSGKDFLSISGKRIALDRDEKTFNTLISTDASTTSHSSDVLNSDLNPIAVRVSRVLIEGGPNADSLYGGPGNDTMYGFAGNDYLFGDWGADSLYGGNGDDTLDGYKGDDSLYGGNGDDYLDGRGGQDYLKGGDGNDTLVGRTNNDNLYGGEGNDILIGIRDVEYGIGEIDTLTGNAGADIFVLATTRTFYDDRNSATAGFSDYAVINDFNVAMDTIQLKRNVSYVLGAVPDGVGLNGTAIFMDNDGTAGLSPGDELIGVIKDVALTYNAITIDTAGFTFVSG